MTNPESNPEQGMKRGERFLRAVGGYTLGFLGISLQASGIASINPLAVAAGTGLAYLGHKVIDPYYTYKFGEPDPEKSKLARFARFNAALVPTYIGASLVGAAVFGGAGFNAAERVAVGVLGVPVLIAGGMIEQRVHTGEPVLGYDHAQPAPDVYQPDHMQPTGLFNRIKSAIQAFRGQPNSPAHA